MRMKAHWGRGGACERWRRDRQRGGGEPGGRNVQKPRKGDVSRVRGHRGISSVRSGKFALDGAPRLRPRQNLRRKPRLRAMRHLDHGRARRGLGGVLLPEFFTQSPLYLRRLAPLIRLVHRTTLYMPRVLLSHHLNTSHLICLFIRDTSWMD